MPGTSFSEDYAELKNITGKFYLSGKHPSDPPLHEPNDTHFNMYLTGSAAKTLFKAMKTKAMPISNVCAEAEPNDKAMAKSIGSTLCTEKPDKKTYECWFSIDIQNQGIDSTWIC
jgi:hypothetical protein